MSKWVMFVFPGTGLYVISIKACSRNTQLTVYHENDFWWLTASLVESPDLLPYATCTHRDCPGQRQGHRLNNSLLEGYQHKMHFALSFGISVLISVHEKLIHVKINPASFYLSKSDPPAIVYLLLGFIRVASRLPWEVTSLDWSVPMVTTHAEPSWIDGIHYRHVIHCCFIIWCYFISQNTLCHKIIINRWPCKFILKRHNHVNADENIRRYGSSTVCWNVLLMKTTIRHVWTVDIGGNLYINYLNFDVVITSTLNNEIQLVIHTLTLKMF